MTVDRSPKSVICFQSPPEVGIVQRLVVAPSMSGPASHRPSGDRTGSSSGGSPGRRSPDTRASVSCGPSSGLARAISVSVAQRPKISEPTVIEEYRVDPSAANGAATVEVFTTTGSPPSTGTLWTDRVTGDR